MAKDKSIKKPSWENFLFLLAIYATAAAISAAVIPWARPPRTLPPPGGF